MSLPSLSVPAALLALQDLVRVEERESRKPRLSSKVSWFDDVFRVSGSALPIIWMPTLLLTIWATVVAVADFVYGREWRLANGVLPLLSVVVGLMLVFRNTSSFARWDQGRVVFTTLMATTRSLCRSIWIAVGAQGPNVKNPHTSDGLSHAEHRRKEQALRLIVAFVVAVKRHVRREYGVDYDDLRALLPTGFYTSEDTPGFGDELLVVEDDGHGEISGPLQPGVPAPTHETETRSVAIQVDGLTPPGSARRPPSISSPLPSPRLRKPWESQRDELDEHAPLLSRHRFHAQSKVQQQQEQPSPPEPASSPKQGSPRPDVSATNKDPYLSKPSLPLPLVIAHQIHLYLADVKALGYLESVGPAGYNALVTSVGGMTENFSQIEKLSSLSIPAIYGIHMKQCTTLYIMALPLTLLDLGWILIPIVAIVSFTLIGIEALARECEDPFGFDSSDLPLNLLTAELRSEIEHMLARLGSTRTALMI